jgi:hypothetical protein
MAWPSPPRKRRPRRCPAVVNRLKVQPGEVAAGLGSP